MLTKISYNNFDIYTEELIHPEDFLKLYRKERIIVSFETKVNNVGKKAFSTFLAKERHSTNIKEGDYVVFRFIKDNKKFEFLSRINKWGKFHIPKIAIETLSINNHEQIYFEVVGEKDKSNEKESNSLDLSNSGRKTGVIFRENNFITLIEKGKIPITLPRFIEITPDLIELCFLIHGDGHYNTKLFFVNKDTELIRFVINKFEEIFRIPKDTWRARLLFNNSASPDVAKKRWKKNLNLREEQFYPSISKCTLNTSELGNLRIVIDKLIVAHVFRSTFDTIKQNIKGANALYALNGLLCAEGNAEKTKGRGLHKITINYSAKEKNMFKEILAEANIINLIKDRKDRFVIEGWVNCYQFFKIFFSNRIIPFDLHMGRCNNALSGFLEHSFTKTMEKYLTILDRKEQMNTNEIMEETNHLGNSVRKLLRKKQYTRFVNSIGRGINRNPIIFSITPEGKEFLTLTKDIREVYNEKNGLG